MKGSKRRPTRTIFLLMTVLVVIGFIIARTYYRGENRSVDPRIRPARELYSQYNRFASESEMDSVFVLLDTIESIYRSIPHYAESFEMGVIFNNRAAAIITLLQFRDSIPALSRVDNYGNLDQQTLCMIAEANLKSSISNYEKWIEDFGGLQDSAISRQVASPFLFGLEQYPGKEQKRYLKKRIEELEDGQVEVPRRLSVAYTNLGILNRMDGKYKEAALLYQKAMDLWEENLAAENNLNRLLGRPLRKKSWLSRMFPKEKIQQNR